MFDNIIFFSAVAGIFFMVLAVMAGAALSPFLWFSLFVFLGVMGMVLSRM